MYQLTIEFDEKNFRKKEFILDVKPKVKKQDAFVFHYGSKNKTRKEHAHLFLGLDGEDSVLRLSYHQGKTEIEDVREPYLEDVVKWFSGFLEEKSIKAFVVGIFEYDKQYKSLIQIDYPLLIGNELYNDTKIVGHDIEFPDNALISRGSITSNESGLRIFLFAKNVIDLSKFDFYLEIEKLSEFANALVKKQGE